MVPTPGMQFNAPQVVTGVTMMQPQMMMAPSAVPQGAYYNQGVPGMNAQIAVAAPMMKY